MSRWVCFNHGKESGPWGSKIQRLAAVAQRRGYRVMSPDYQGLDQLDMRIEKLRAELPTACDRLVLAGSSMGAYVAAAVSAHCDAHGLFLLAPAVYLPGYASDTLVPVANHRMVVHGWGDEVVPVDNAIRWCRQHNVPLLLLDSDHRLMSALDTICETFGHFLDELDS